MDIVRKLLSPDELGDPNLRYNPDTDTVQRSPDGGTTWINSPGEDLRHVDSNRKPPLTGSDVKCRAAANMVATVKASNDGFIARSGSAALLSFALGITLLLALGVGWIIFVLVTVVAAFEAAGSATVNAEFTSGVYDDLLCIFFCNMGDDGSVNATELADIRATINAHYTNSVATMMNVYLDAWGEVGLSNAGTIGSATGDCGSCACAEDCASIWFNLGTANGFIPFEWSSALRHFLAVGSYDPAQGFTTQTGFDLLPQIGLKGRCQNLNADFSSINFTSSGTAIFAIKITVHDDPTTILMSGEHAIGAGGGYSSPITYSGISNTDVDIFIGVQGNSGVTVTLHGEFNQV